MKTISEFQKQYDDNFITDLDRYNITEKRALEIIATCHKILNNNSEICSYDISPDIPAALCIKNTHSYIVNIYTEFVKENERLYALKMGLAGLQLLVKNVRDNSKYIISKGRIYDYSQY